MKTCIDWNLSSSQVKQETSKQTPLPPDNLLKYKCKIYTFIITIIGINTTGSRSLIVVAIVRVSVSTVIKAKGGTSVGGSAQGWCGISSALKTIATNII
jgi:hypothetical protein